MLKITGHVRIVHHVAINFQNSDFISSPVLKAVSCQIAMQVADFRSSVSCQVVENVNDGGYPPAQRISHNQPANRHFHKGKLGKFVIVHVEIVKKSEHNQSIGRPKHLE